MKKLNYDRITTTIEREWLAQIVCWHEKDRVPQGQAVLDEALREGLAAIRTAAVERDESASAGSDRADPQDHKGPPGGRI
jgi:hypothetical protein